MPAKHTPRYIQIASYLRTLIQTHNLDKGAPLPTEFELCRKFDCSRGTIREAMILLTREGKIRRRRGAGTFVAEPFEPDKGSRRLAAIIPNVTTSEFARFVQTLGMAANESGYTLILGVTNDVPEIESSFINEIIQLRVRGVLKFPTNIELESQTRERLRNSGIPCLVVNDFWTDCREDYHIAYDECMAMDMAVQHLVKLGHRSIVLLEDQGWPRAKAIDAFCKALARHNLPSSEDHVLLYDIRLPHAPPLEKLYNEAGPNPTGLITIYDVVSARLLAQLRRFELRVPDDVSVVNIGGMSTMTMGLDLTAAVPPDRKMIDQALQLLKDGLHRGHVRHYLFEPEFHVGQSSGPCPKKAETAAGVQAAAEHHEPEKPQTVRLRKE